MPRPARLARARGLGAAALSVVPVVVVLAGPVSAASPSAQVAPAPEGCGVVLTLAGLAEGAHTAVVRTTLRAGGDPVPVAAAPPVADAAVSTTPGPSPSRTATPRPSASATPQPSASPSGAAAPLLAAERSVDAEGELVVLLDAASVPDADPQVVVVVTVDGEALPASGLALPGCGAPATASAGPTAASSPPAVEPTPSASTGPTPTPTATATATASPSPSTSPPSTPAPVTPAPPAAPAAASPVLTGAPDPVVTPALDGTLAQAYGAYDGGSSGYVSLMSFAAAPRLDSAALPAPVPAPVIAAPEGSAAGVLAAPPRTGASLEDLLPQRPAQDDGGAPAQLVAPDLLTDASADPLVDLAPAAVVLTASLGGLLVTGRRRRS